MKLTMKIFAYLFLSLSLSATANECNVSPELLSAYYKVTSVQKSSLEKPNVINKDSQSLELHRNKSRVLKNNMGTGIHNIWTVHDDRYSLTRAFDKYQHAIEYQPNELNYHLKKKDIFQVVSTPELSAMTLVKEEKSGCQLTQHYTLKDKYNTYQLAWLPKLKLIASFKVQNPTITKEWLLNNYESNIEEINTLFSQYDNYQSTDYADIGDNESIPFLATMIHQGFTTSQKHQAASLQHAHEH